MLEYANSCIFPLHSVACDLVKIFQDFFFLSRYLIVYAVKNWSNKIWSNQIKLIKFNKKNEYFSHKTCDNS